MAYHQWNNRRGGMSNGGRVVARDDSGISNDDMATHVPSIFANDAHASRSERFVPIPTISVIDGLRAEGFVPFFAQQSKTRDASRREFTKHMIRMRHRSLANATGEAFEIILVNANDGSAAYRMLPGFFRFVCMNGLFLGDAFKAISVRHSGDAVANVVSGAYDVLAIAPNAAEILETFKGITVPDWAAREFANSVHAVRFPDAWEAETIDGEYTVVDGESVPATRDVLVPHRAPVDPDALLMTRRADDNRNDLWTLFNRVQENALRGGFRGRIRSDKSRTGFRNATMREVTGINQTESLNQEIANRAQRLAEFLRG